MNQSPFSSDGWNIHSRWWDVPLGILGMLALGYVFHWLAYSLENY